MCKILKSFSVVPVCVPAREAERKKNYFLPLRVRYMEKKTLGCREGNPEFHQMLEEISIHLRTFALTIH
ncbi:hypothetical protein CDAR_45101 [Caerostris darwini]|uniref:Uncharacterized protein n=1 Tax=Caerostris darwini TaxID=1538125 RepID=A0AAV4UZ26_9ARAC|nr:hypothetical protein CDAR_45102 [Caerostris darwini]GIY62719.1 hypothetical protein CDAR_45101 [Caerostris darwini]